MTASVAPTGRYSLTGSSLPENVRASFIGSDVRHEAPKSDPAPAPSRETGGAPIYHRVVEELAVAMSPERARQVVDASLRGVDQNRDDAAPYDYRLAILDVLPGLLAYVVRASDIEPLVAAVERALVDVHRPASVV